MASIDKRGDSYRIRVSRGYDAAGKKLKPFQMNWTPPEGISEKKLEKELNRIAVEFEMKCREGEVCTESSMKLSQFCPMYLDLVSDSLSPTTKETYARYIDQLIIPALGHMKVSEIKPVHVQRFIKQIQNTPKPNGDPPSAATVKRKLVCLQSIMRQAVKLGMIPTSPADAKKLTLPKIVTPEVEIFTKQEAAAILDALADEPLQFQACIQLAILTGARLGELVALKFSDVDFDNNKIKIERAAYKLKGQAQAVKPPKDYDVRTVSITQECTALIAMVQEEKKQLAAELGTAWHEEDWILTQWDGTMMHKQTPSARFRKFLKKHGLKVRKFHALRHTSATLLLYSGVNIRQVQSRLGHGNITTTQRYLHAIKDADEEAVNALQNLLITQHKADAEAKRKAE